MRLIDNYLVTRDVCNGCSLRMNVIIVYKASDEMDVLFNSSS